MGKMAAAADVWGGRLANLVTLWPVLLPATAFGAVMAFLSVGVDWIGQFGAFGWMSAGLVSFAILAFALAALAWFRTKWIQASAEKNWHRRTDFFNPLEKEFRSIRLKILDVANPVNNKIINKRFLDCELLGPANVVFDGGTLHEATLQNVDFVVCRPDAYIQYPIHMKDCQVIGGSIAQCVIFIPAEMAGHIAAMGGNFLTLSGIPEVDKIITEKAKHGQRG